MWNLKKTNFEEEKMVFEKKIFFVVIPRVPSKNLAHLLLPLGRLYMSEELCYIDRTLYRCLFLPKKYENDRPDQSQTHKVQRMRTQRRLHTIHKAFTLCFRSSLKPSHCVSGRH